MVRTKFTMHSGLALTFGSALVLATVASPLPAKLPLPATVTATATATALVRSPLFPVRTATQMPAGFPARTATPVATWTPYVGPYPELYAVVDAALATATLEMHTPVRNAANDGWVFSFTSEWTPPDLEGVPGAAVHLPGDVPYYYTVELQIRSLTAYPGKLMVDSGHLTDQTNVSDLRLPKGVYEWRIRGYYRSMLYEAVTEWMPWERFEVQ